MISAYYSCDCTTPDMYDCSSKNLKNIVNVTDDEVRTLDLNYNSIKKTSVCNKTFFFKKLG